MNHSPAEPKKNNNKKKKKKTEEIRTNKRHILNHRRTIKTELQQRNRLGTVSRKTTWDKMANSADYGQNVHLTFVFRISITLQEKKTNNCHGNIHRHFYRIRATFKGKIYLL